MKIKQYIVTYNNEEQINKCLDSIFNSLTPVESDILDIYIINNHTNFKLNPKFSDKVEVIHNNLRPDFSTGHLSRNWNQAIINGFKNINEPDCDILITNQDDTEFEINYISNLIQLHNKYDFIQFGAGDNFCSYTTNHIKQVGLWDERFCNIGYQEADYFLRSVLYNKDRCCLNDWYHNRVNNGEVNTIIKKTHTGHARGEVYHTESLKYHKVSRNVFTQKWGFNPSDPNNASINWDFEKIMQNQIEPQILSFIYYPYFECNVNLDSMRKQKYVL